MGNVLFLTHTDEGGNLSKLSLEALSAAKKLAGDLSSNFHIGLFGEQVQAAADKLSSASAEKIYGVTGNEFMNARYSSDAAACETICKAADISYVVAPSTSRMSRVLAGVSVRVGGCIDTHVTGITVSDGKLSVDRWYYKQRMQGNLTRTQTPWFLSVDAGSFDVWTGDSASTNIEILNVEMTDSLKRTTFEGYKAPPADEQTIKPDAETLFVAGAGWTKKQSDGQVHADKAANHILDFLKKSGASLGGSKSVVDLSSEGEAVLPFMTHLNQVGQTGSTPVHQKGLSTCCHGEEPHVVGWRFINERRAVNLDPNCGWAQGKADVLYVADAFEVMAKVNELMND